jgi:hypothetical protein
VTDRPPNHSLATSGQLAVEVNRLAEEVRLLSINLAIALAKTQGKEQTLQSLGPQFSELIKKAHDTSRQVMDILGAYQCRGRMIGSLPRSTEAIERGGGYDRIEATLNHVCQLSEQINTVISAIQRRQGTGS